MTSLADLDVQQNLQRTIESLLDTVRKIDAQVSRGAAGLSLDARTELDLVARKLAEAEEYYARALDSKELYTVLESIHRHLGDQEGAERFARQGRMFQADELEFKGRMEAFYGNNAKALEHFDHALKLIPDHALALKGREGAQKRVEKSKKDLEKLKKAAEAKKTSKDWIALGSAFADVGRLDDAFAAFDEAVKADPNNPDAWARKGTALHGRGKVSDALAMYRKAVEIKPTSMTGRRGVNYATFQLENPGA